MIRILLLTLLFTPAAFAQAMGKGPVDITAQQLDVQQKKGTAVFSGDVVVKQGEMTLTAPKVTATYGSKGGDIEAIEATGGVTITRPGQNGVTEKAVGTTALYSPANGNMVMTGAVTLTRGPSQLSGDKLTYDLANGNARVTNSKGPVKARFVPNAK